MHEYVRFAILSLSNNHHRIFPDHSFILRYKCSKAKSGSPKSRSKTPAGPRHPARDVKFLLNPSIARWRPSTLDNPGLSPSTSFSSVSSSSSSLATPISSPRVSPVHIYSEPFSAVDDKIASAADTLMSLRAPPAELAVPRRHTTSLGKRRRD